MRRYRDLVVSGPFRAVEPAEVGALERELGRPLPAAYRAFLEVANGGQLDYAIRVPNEPDGEVTCYSDLYALGCGDDGKYGYGTLLGEYRAARDWWLASEVNLEGWLPIARTGGDDDTLFLDLRPGTYGRVIAHLSGIPWPGYNHDNQLATVADSFDAYLQSLFIESEYAADVLADIADLRSDDPERLAVEAWLSSRPAN